MRLGVASYGRRLRVRGERHAAAEFKFGWIRKRQKLSSERGCPGDGRWHLSRSGGALESGGLSKILALGRPVAEFVIHSNSVAADAIIYKPEDYGISLPDPSTMAIALHPELCTASSMHYARC